MQLYCFRIYDISSSSDEKSEETDKESDDDGNDDSKVTKAVTGMQIVILISLSVMCILMAD